MLPMVAVHAVIIQGDSDVLACAVDPQTRAVVLIDAYNPPSLIRAHERDTIQVS